MGQRVIRAGTPLLWMPNPSSTLMKGFTFFDGDGHVMYNFYFSFSIIGAQLAGWQRCSVMVGGKYDCMVVGSDDQLV